VREEHILLFLLLPLLLLFLLDIILFILIVLSDYYFDLLHVGYVGIYLRVILNFFVIYFNHFNCFVYLIFIFMVVVDLFSYFLFSFVNLIVIDFINGFMIRFIFIFTRMQILIIFYFRIFFNLIGFILIIIY
jgi:hypothetical protein